MDGLQAHSENVSALEDLRVKQLLELDSELEALNRQGVPYQFDNPNDPSLLSRRAEDWADQTAQRRLGPFTVSEWDEGFDGAQLGGLTVSLLSTEAASPPSPYTADSDPVPGVADRTVEGVSPDYDRPPGNLERLDLLCCMINDLRVAQAMATADGVRGQQDIVETTRRGDQLQQIRQAVAQTTKLGDRHVSDVADTAAANEAQTARQQEAETQLMETKRRMTGVETMESMLVLWISGAVLAQALFEGLASVVGSAQSMVNKCKSSRIDSERFLGALKEVRAVLTKQQQASPLAMGRLNRDAETIDRAGQMNIQAREDISRSDQGVQTAQQQNQSDATAAGQFCSTANVDGAQAKTEAEKLQAEHDRLAEALNRWAQHHARQRHDAVRAKVTKVETAGGNVENVYDF